MARARSGKSAPARPRKPRRKRIIVIDDEIGADPLVRPHSGYNRDDFVRGLSQRDVVWCFHDSYHAFLADYLVEASTEFAAGTPKADVVLVDLMFGAHRTLGFDIIEMMQASKHAGARFALLTTHRGDDKVWDKDERTTLRAWVERRGIGLLSKELLFQPDAFWREVDALARPKTGARGKK